MTSTLEGQARAYRRTKEKQASEARQRAAFFLITGIDLDDALKKEGPEKERLLARLARLIERERQKGARRHWSYDLNRHIALKQAFDRLNGHDFRIAAKEERRKPARTVPTRERVRQRQRRRRIDAPPSENRSSR